MDEIVHKGIRIQPGELKYHDGRTFSVVGETPTSYVTLDQGKEVHANKSDAHSFSVTPHKQLSKPAYVVTKDHAHFPTLLNEHQIELIDGLDLDLPQKMKVADGIHTEIAARPPFVAKGRNGHIFVKHSPDEQTEKDLLGEINHPEFQLHTREEAFHRLGKDVFGIDLPVTATVKTKHGPAMVQEFREGRHIKPGEPESDIQLSRIPQSDRERALVMDYVLGNPDRHDGNFKVDKGKLHLFDHGFTFLTGGTWVIPEYVRDSEHKQDLSDDTKEWLKALPHEKISGMLAAYGAPQQITSKVLERLGKVQEAARRGGRVSADDMKRDTL